VGWFTLRAVRHQAEIASKTLNAISQQVTVALRDLKRGRPSLFIDEVSLDRSHPSPEHPSVTITFKNYGQNPALIDLVEGTMRIVYWSNGNLSGPTLDYSLCLQRPSPRDIVGPGQSFSVDVPLFPTRMSAEDHDLVERGEARLVVYGRVRYRDFADGRYVRGFWWETDDFAAKFCSKVVFKRGPETFNYDEEEEKVADWFQPTAGALTGAP
jgi:hypothetical protein